MLTLRAARSFFPLPHGGTRTRAPHSGLWRLPHAQPSSNLEAWEAAHHPRGDPGSSSLANLLLCTHFTEQVRAGPGSVRTPAQAGRPVPSPSSPPAPCGHSLQIFGTPPGSAAQPAQPSKGGSPVWPSPRPLTRHVTWSKSLNVCEPPFSHLIGVVMRIQLDTVCDIVSSLLGQTVQ